MKTFKEYLAESKKVYNFKIKVAGDLPENFEKDLKARLDGRKIVTFEKVTTTPIQALPLDFPDHPNMPVSIFEVVVEYPITAPELVNELKELSIPESCFRVRGSNEPSEQEQVLAQAEPSGEATLNDVQLADAPKVKAKDYFGDEFNKSFLKDLEKTAKARKKEEGQGEYKLPKQKQDKAGTTSPMSKIANPDPIKG